MPRLRPGRSAPARRDQTRTACIGVAVFGPSRGYAPAVDPKVAQSRDRTIAALRTAVEVLPTALAIERDLAASAPAERIERVRGDIDQLEQLIAETEERIARLEALG